MCIYKKKKYVFQCKIKNLFNYFNLKGEDIMLDKKLFELIFKILLFANCIINIL